MFLKWDMTRPLKENYMPLYEYKCKNCSEVSEHYQSGDDKKEIACNGCGSTRLERITYSSFSVGSSSILTEPRCDMGPACGSCCSDCRIKG